MTELLVLHATRILGFADTSVIARRFELDPREVNEVLLDAEARGWVQQAGFAGLRGWTLTALGRTDNERMLAAELNRPGSRAEVAAVYGDFLPLNARLQRACTDWQLTPAPGDRLAVNDHSDPVWDAAVLDELSALHRALGPLVDRLVRVLSRFQYYDTRFGHAVERARSGDGAWVDRTDIDSCHKVWFELHEDLIATLGLHR